MSNGDAATPRKTFPGISPRAYEHPTDRAALVAMRAVPGFDLVLRKFLGLIGERALRLIYLGSSVRVTERQFPEVHRVFGECVEALDLKERPELYVAQTPFVNAGAVGWDHPFVVLNSGTLALLDEAELRVVLSHELAHILSGHVLYKTMMHMLIRFSFLAAGVPIGYLTLYAVIAALKEWDRKSELSADRAGLLVGQDLEVSYRLLMKLAGGTGIEQMNLDEFVRQAEEYEAGGDYVDSVAKILNLVDKSHPFAVLRLAEMRRWVQSGEYDRILAGEYPRRSEDSSASFMDEVRSSMKNYKESFEESKDPLARFFRDIGDQLSNTGKGVWGRFRGRDKE